MTSLRYAGIMGEELVDLEEERLGCAPAVKEERRLSGGS
jgi:hypothetical protein